MLDANWYGPEFEQDSDPTKGDKTNAKKSVDEYFFISELRIFLTTGFSGMIGLNIAFSWTGGTQATETQQFAPSPAGPWVAVETIPPPTTPEMTRSLPRPGGHAAGFFRVAASR